jgi:hypothetical protein
MRYVDFDLLIEAGEHGFEARVLSSPAGEARHEFGLPFTPLERNELLLRLAQDTRPGRGFNKDATLAAKELGGRLFEAVFDEDVGARLLSSIQSAEAEEYGLRIRLRIETPELAQLPWEYLYDARLNQFLALSRSTSVVRYLELPRPPRPLHVARPLTMLVLISSPKDYPELNTEEEWDNLNIALGKLPEGVVEVERVEPTLAALRARLRRGPVHVLHFIGHGEFDEAAQDGLIVLQDDKGNSLPVSSEKLAVILNNHPSIRLAVLNCCEGARSSAGNPFSGVAPALIQKGLPAVVAMQFAIADTAAITFASNFYQSIADGLAIDDALVEARTSMFVTADEEAFGAPVLYTRSHDGVLFDLDAKVPEAPVARPAETPGEGAARPKPGKTSPSRFWNGRSIDSTRLHERSAGGDPTVLVVLVHGPDGDPVKTWRDIPKWVLEAVGDDADVLSYATPDLTSSPDAVAEAARGLRRVILARPCFSMHLFFLAQGSGAAVVRELLAADVESVRQQRIGILAQMPPIAAKTRVVFQFPAERKPARRRAVKRKAPPESTSQDSSAGAALHGRLQRALNRLRANDFPRPRLVQFAADEDFVAIEGHEDVVELIPENGSEKSTDLPSRREDLRIEAMAELMRPYFHSPDMAVSYVTLRRMVGLDGRIDPIAETADFSARSETPAADAWIGSSGSQQQALQWLRELSEPDHRGEHPRILITGSAGVGKSTVLRRHARCVTARFLERQDAAQLCIYIPMQSATLDGNQKKAMLLGADPALRWRALCEYAVTLFREILLDPEEETAFADDEPPTDTDSWKSVGDLFTVEWAEKDATSGPSVIVWDGIDEFLVNYSALTVDTIAELLGVIEGTSPYARTQCLLAARITLPAIRELSRHRDVYEILPLSERTAETWFPGLHRLLKDLPDGDLRRLLLSPLVLVRLSPLAARIDQQSLAGRVAMLRYALNTLIGQSRLPKLRLSTNGSSTDGWFQALALTAWAMYSDGLGSIEMTALIARIQQLKAVWSRGTDAVYQRFAQGFAVFESEATVSALRSRTVLDSLGRGGVRFTHRDGRILCLPITSRNVRSAGCSPSSISGDSPNRSTSTPPKICGEPPSTKAFASTANGSTACCRPPLRSRILRSSRMCARCWATGRPTSIKAPSES